MKLLNRVGRSAPLLSNDEQSTTFCPSVLFDVRKTVRFCNFTHVSLVLDHQHASTRISIVLLHISEQTGLLSSITCVSRELVERSSLHV